jgi:hypothetical protein
LPPDPQQLHELELHEPHAEAPTRFVVPCEAKVENSFLSRRDPQCGQVAPRPWPDRTNNSLSRAQRSQ